MSISKQLAAMAEQIDTAPDRAGVDAQYRRACGFWDVEEEGDEEGGENVRKEEA